MNLKSIVMAAAFAAATPFGYNGYAEEKPAVRQEKRHEHKISVAVANGKDVKTFSQEAVKGNTVLLEQGDKLVYRYEINADNVTQFLLMVDAKVKIDEKTKEAGLAALVLLDGGRFEEPESMNNVSYKRVNFNDFKDKTGNYIIGKGLHTLDLLVFDSETQAYEAHALFRIK